MYQIETDDEEQTKQYAKNLASILKKGDVLVLSGELGARKNQICRRDISVFWNAR